MVWSSSSEVEDGCDRARARAEAEEAAAARHASKPEKWKSCSESVAVALEAAFEVGERAGRAEPVVVRLQRREVVAYVDRMVFVDVTTGREHRLRRSEPEAPHSFSFVEDCIFYATSAQICLVCAWRGVRGVV